MNWEATSSIPSNNWTGLSGLANELKYTTTNIPTSLCIKDLNLDETYEYLILDSNFLVVQKSNIKILKINEDQKQVRAEISHSRDIIRTIIVREHLFDLVRIRYKLY